MPDELPILLFATPAELEAWLEESHAESRGLWLKIAKKGTEPPSVTYAEALELALCFGWIDGQGGNLDEQRARQYFTPRKRGSGWSRSNKERVARMIADGKMAAAGLEVIEAAKADGSWSLLDAVEALEVPEDLAAALAKNATARRHFEGFTPGARKQILYWIATAKRAETRQRRVAETVRLAAKGLRANQDEE